MTTAAHKVVNFVGFQAAWFACVLAAASGRPGLACAAVLAWVAVHVLLSADRGTEIALIAAAGAAGYALDSGLVYLGALSFPERALLGGPSSLWMAGLWMSFATTLNGCLAWLGGRFVLGAALGAAGGPIAYAAGVRFGAIAWGEPAWRSAALVAAEWALATPMLLLLASRCSGGRLGTRVARPRGAEA